MKRIESKKAILLVLGILFSGPIWALASQTSWFQEPASLTIQEFLDMTFRSHLKVDLPVEAYSHSEVNTVMSEDPQEGVVIVNVYWNAEGVDEDHLKMLMGIQGMGLVRMFEKLVGYSGIVKRWPLENPSENILVVHLRSNPSSGLGEIPGLGITFRGETIHDPVLMMEIIESRFGD